MKTFRVSFLPAAVSNQVDARATLLQAATRLGVPLRHVCGGQASCTTCRVRLEQGRLTPPGPKETARLPEVRLAHGWRLACQARPLSDVTVRVPSLLEWLALARQEQ